VILPDDLEGRDGHFNRALKVDPSSCLLGICEELQNARSAFYFEYNKAAGLSGRKNLIIHFNWRIVTCHFDPVPFHRARAAFLALSLRCSAVILRAVAFPPFRPNFARCLESSLFFFAIVFAVEIPPLTCAAAAHTVIRH
jgi:hypothetical protein